MSVLISDAEVAIRLMRDEPGDYQVMSKWLSDPRVLEFYEGRDHPLALEQIESEYAPRIHDEEDVTPCLIILQSAPIGYMQFYLVGEESRNSYGLPADECLEAVYGINQFIGEFHAGIALQQPKTNLRADGAALADQMKIASGRRRSGP